MDFVWTALYLAIRKLNGYNNFNIIYESLHTDIVIYKHSNQSLRYKHFAMIHLGFIFSLRYKILTKKRMYSQKLLPKMATRQAFMDTVVFCIQEKLKR